MSSEHRNDTEESFEEMNHSINTLDSYDDNNSFLSIEDSVYSFPRGKTFHKKTSSSIGDIDISDLVENNNEKKEKKRKTILNPINLFILNFRNDEETLYNALKFQKKLEENDQFFKRSDESTFLFRKCNSKLQFLYKKNFHHFRELIIKERQKEWREFVEQYKRQVKKSQNYKYKIRRLFYYKTDFVDICKFIFSFFDVIIVLVYFYKYLITELLSNEDNQIPQRIKTFYFLINFMFFLELIFYLLYFYNNKSTPFSYFEIGIKMYCVIPFSLKRDNINFLIPKFFRIDSFSLFVTSLENFINTKLTPKIKKYRIKIIVFFLSNIIKISFLLNIYVHFTCCLICYYDETQYISSIFYTFETLSTVGFGEHKIKDVRSFYLVIINLFFGIMLFSYMVSNLHNMLKNLKNFEREIYFYKNFEFFIYSTQKNFHRVFPLWIKNKLIRFYNFKTSTSFKCIIKNYNEILNSCNANLTKKIEFCAFLTLNEKFKIFFDGIDKDFINTLFSFLRPKEFLNNELLIKYNHRVNNMFFILNGGIFAYDKHNNPIYCMSNSCIIGDYEFITNELSDFNIKTHPNTGDFGFILKRKDWVKICQKDVLNVQKFIKKIMDKRKIHLFWLNKIHIKDHQIEINNYLSKKLNLNKNNKDVKYRTENDISNKTLELKKEKEMEEIKNNNNENKKLKEYLSEKNKIGKKIKSLNDNIQKFEINMFLYKERLSQYAAKN